MMLRWWWISALVILFDQLTKLSASKFLQMHDPVAIMPLFNFTLMHNTGAAFSFLSNAGGWQRWFFTVLAIAVSILIISWVRKLGSHEKWQAAGLLLVLGGALGNVIDRLVYGYVIDFLDVYYSAQSCLPMFYQTLNNGQLQCHWPAFNIADSAISIGVVVLIWDGIQDYRRQKQRATG